MAGTKDRWATLNVKVKAPEGSVYVQILEDSPGVIYRIFIHVGKCGSSVNTMCFALAETLSDLLREGKTINEIIVRLSGITSDRSNRKGPGCEAGSIPEALAIALMKYRTTIPTSRYDRPPIRFKGRI